MVFSPPVMRAALAAAGLAALLALAPAAAQEEPPQPGEAAPVVLVASGTATLATPPAAPLPIRWAETAQGPLFALDPLVARLGGRVETGALGESYTLSIGQASMLLAPGSAAATVGTEIVALSQPPLELEGALLVPLDLLEKSFGAELGIRFQWAAAERRLSATRPPTRELPVEYDLVHLQGVTTVVLQFPEAPRYRVERDGTAWQVVLIGDRAVAPRPRERAEDPLVRRVVVAADRIRLELAPGAAADQYTLKEPFRIVFDVYRADSSAAAPAGAPSFDTVRRGIRTVVIDPGHGGKETGAIGPSGTAEKELTLAISQALAARLEESLKVRAVLTRQEDLDLGLDERSALANQYRADLFVSVHLNSTVRGGARGAETYFLSLQASDQRAADAAAVENYVGAGTAAPGTEEFDLQLLLWDLAQSQHLAASQRLATLIQEELNRQLELKDRGVKQAPFRVLMGAAMPAVLVELGFISTAEEEQKLRDPAYRAELVETLVRAIGRFKSEYDPAPAGAAP
jgi:N-acetylmuramoyl-L-alanine amidase